MTFGTDLLNLLKIYWQIQIENTLFHLGRGNTLHIYSDIISRGLHELLVNDISFY